MAAHKEVSFREWNFVDFASLVQQGRVARRPRRVFGGQSKRAKIPSPKAPFPFARLIEGRMRKQIANELGKNRP
jgi:hypothetical protein